MHITVLVDQNSKKKDISNRTITTRRSDITEGQMQRRTDRILHALGKAFS